MKRNLFVAAALLVAITLGVVGTFNMPTTTTAQDGGNLIGLDHPYAAFLESRAYAAEQGATAEFNKMEYVAIDDTNMKLYIAMSDITGGLTDGEGDISVDENRCGIVYEADLDAEYNTTELRPLLVGGPFDPEGGENRCPVDNISNPDNLEVDARGRLWIGEDTGNHENNMIWVYDPADGSLKRFGYTPLGAEATGLRITENGTLFLGVQHPDADVMYPYNSSVFGVVAGFNAHEDDFESIAVPEGDDKRIAAVAAGEYQILGRVGDPIPGSATGFAFGEIRDVAGNTMFFCNQFDGSMWIPHNSAGTEGTVYANVECRPGGVARMHIRETEGQWEVLDGEMVDFSGVNGTWNNCGASMTPWGTGLTGEEYEPFAGDFASVSDLTDYLGTQANPYDYGWMVELEPRDGVNDRVTKRYALGRKSNENAWVAGDEQTVYFGDDGGNVVLFKFVAEIPGDLASGTLYAAKVTQSGGTGADQVLGLEWIELGYGFDDEIEEAIRALDPQ